MNEPSNNDSGCAFACFVGLIILAACLDATFDKLFARLDRIDQALGLPPAAAEMENPDDGSN